MTVVEIQDAAQRALSLPVRYGSVVKLLCAEASDPGSAVKREGRGSYRIGMMPDRSSPSDFTARVRAPRGVGDARFIIADGQALTAPEIVDDGERLETLRSGVMDFVIASHFMEHCEDPIGTLKAHLRVLRPSASCSTSFPTSGFPLMPIGK